MSDSLIEYNFAAGDLVKAGRTSSYNIEGMRKWLKLMPTIPELSDEQIAIFLIACKNDIEATKNCILCFFKYKAAAPELFANRDIDGDEFIHTCQVASVAIMPHRTKENYAVLVGALKDTSYSSFNVDSQVKLVFTWLDYILHDNPPSGLLVVLNMKGVGLMHMTRLKITTLKKVFQFLQEALPTQLKQIHILNTSYVFDKILMLIKPFMNKELYDMIITHSPNCNMDEFFTKYIPKDMFPSDFSGNLSNLDQLAQETRYQCRKLRSYLDACEKQIELYKDNRK